MNQTVDFAAQAEDVASSRLYMQRVDDGLAAVERMRGKVSQLLLAQNRDASWLERIGQAVDDLQQLAREYPDLTLYFLLNEKVNNPAQYSALHSVCCAMMVVLGGAWLGWPESDLRAVTGAALTMNLAMGEMQDQLARQLDPPSMRQREVIRHHAERSAEALEQVGVTDPLWLQAVREHHTVHADGDADSLEPGQRAAELLRRVDVYAAKLSRRRTRQALTPALAARGALLGPADHPDAMGATLLRVLGLYPPGTYVELANGELGVVIERGNRAHTPLVASLRRGDGSVLLVPQARDTSLRAHAVRRGVDGAVVHVRPGHQQVLKSRLQLGLPAALVPPAVVPDGAAGSTTATSDAQAAEELEELDAIPTPVASQAREPGRAPPDDPEAAA